jgi:hypothetical protein
LDAAIILTWRHLRAAMLAATVLLAAPALADPPAPLDIAVKPVALNLDKLEQRQVGKLIYRGGIAMTARDSRFGGWSGLRLNADKTRFTAVSDRGAWLEARLVFDGAGNLAGVREARIGDLIDLAGRRLRWPLTDSEGLARQDDGSFIVSFERRHRLWLYPAAEPPFSRPPRALATPPRLSEAPLNGGIEAVAVLKDGRLFAIAEELRDDNANVAWIGDGKSWQMLRYRPGLSFLPTDVVQMDDGDVLVLERRFSFAGVPGGRVVRVKYSDIQPGALVTGEELAVLEWPLVLDNYEGIATATGARGETIVYIMSDDNFSFLQNNLLLMFEIAR